MKKIFSKIRQKYISENRISKYLIYAVGEIILVVIGILIALEFNNLNEQKKLRKLELSTLISFQEALKEDSINLQASASYLVFRHEQFNILLQHLKNKQPYNPRLDTIFGETLANIFFIKENYTAYDFLKSRGFDLITNEYLRTSISKHYNQNFKETASLANYFNQNHTLIADKVFGEFICSNPGHKFLAKPISYEKIINDVYFISRFNHLEAISQGEKECVMSLLDQTKDLLSKIKNEIKMLNN